MRELCQHNPTVWAIFSRLGQSSMGRNSGSGRTNGSGPCPKEDLICRIPRTSPEHSNPNVRARVPAGSSTMIAGI